MKHTPMKNITTKDWCFSFSYLFCAILLGNFAFRAILDQSYLQGFLLLLGFLGWGLHYLRHAKYLKNKNA